MQVSVGFRSCHILIALVAVAWTGCATTTDGLKPFSLASYRDHPATSSADLEAPSQFAIPGRADVPPADGYQAQFVSAPRPQRRYTKPSCNTGLG